MPTTASPGRLAELADKLASGQITKVRLRHACGEIKEHDALDYLELPMAAVLGAEFLGFVEDPS